MAPRATCSYLAKELIELMSEGIGRELALQRVQRRLVRARDQAESAAKAKSEFLATMSHEIRTPLNGVLGMAELLHDTVLDITQRDYVNTIRSCGDNLQTLLGDILDLSRIEAGRVVFDRVALDPADLADEVVGILAPDAHAKGLTIAVGCRDDVPPQVVGDIGRLRQVLLNLVGNAVKFTSVGSVFVDLSMADAETLEVAVIDTGVGIPPARQHQIFEAFAQADGSTTRNFGGTGLGLTISKRLVTLMGGDIFLRSRPGAGSCFRVSLPVELPELPLPPERPFAGHTLTVLGRDLRVCERLSGRLKSWGAMLVDEPVDASAVVVALGPGDSLPQLPDRPILLLTPAASRTAIDKMLNTLPVKTLGFPWRRELVTEAMTQLLTRRARASSSAMRAAVDKMLLGRRVLVAEDNPVNRKLAQTMLAKLGCEVVAVENGHEAVEALASQCFDLVVMDCQMPVLDGYEATRQIRASGGEHAAVPILAMTANAMAGDRERCLVVGMNGYVAKPVRSDDLRREMAALLAPQDK
ncbi:MAG: ATP-binding protein [Planctomycetota bacterium]|jgi:two-component system sensor histidine kinase/response regulator|nr:ATP-binding protein [Planctomycetota bacterium]